MQNNPAELLRLPQVCAIVALRRSEIYRRIKAGRFPASIRLGKNAVAWLRSDLDAWIAARVAESRGSAA